ncbi:hypothetical protein ABZP36_028482 [Zizania latifolia]
MEKREGSRGEDGSVNGMISEFGDDNFAVENWKLKEIVSRDGHMKISSQVLPSEKGGEELVENLVTHH